eukprot:gene4159-5923_t
MLQDILEGIGALARDEGELNSEIINERISSLPLNEDQSHFKEKEEEKVGVNLSKNIKGNVVGDLHMESGYKPIQTKRRNNASTKTEHRSTSNHEVNVVNSKYKSLPSRSKGSRVQIIDDDNELDEFIRQNKTGLNIFSSSYNLDKSNQKKFFQSTNLSNNVSNTIEHELNEIYHEAKQYNNSKSNQINNHYKMNNTSMDVQDMFDKHSSSCNELNQSATISNNNQVNDNNVDTNNQSLPLRSKRVKNLSSKDSVTSIICPICVRSIQINCGNNPDEVLSIHIDRCSRRTSTMSKSSFVEESEKDDPSSDSHLSDPHDDDNYKPSKRSDVDTDDDNDDDILNIRNTKNTAKSKMQKQKQKKSLKNDNTNKLNSKKISNKTKPFQNDNKNDLEFVDNGDDSCQENENAIFKDLDPFCDDWEDYAYEGRLQQSNVDLEDYSFTAYGTQVPTATWSSLHDYQKEGCNWLFDLYQEGVGGILGDEMGLGKTAQLCTHFGSLAKLHLQRNTRNKALFLVVCPATVLQHWLDEMHRWTPMMRTVILHSISATGAELNKLGDAGTEIVIRNLQSSPTTRGLTIVTTYEGLRKHRSVLNLLEYTAVCLDEGQKIRNPVTSIATICKLLPAFHRIILSGTPIQNNLKELWSLFDFIYPGRLGTYMVFEKEFVEPIRTGGYLNITRLQYEIALRSAMTLQRIVKPYLLRRKKDDLALITKLPKKTEQILYCRISERQKQMYLDFISSNEVKAVLEKKLVAFRAINILRKLCNHPALIVETFDKNIKWENEVNNLYGNILDDEDDIDNNNIIQKRFENLKNNNQLLWNDSGKLLALSKILPLWYQEGHKVLLFSQTRIMLDLIEYMMKDLSFSYVRLDGNIPVAKRASIIHDFNHNKNIFIILLTTKTGGVGISLTAANRVILFDPDWNPMNDIQSRERAWRLGQTREVTIFRLISKGTIEEKIYQRQIYKLLLTNRILDNPRQKALFSKSELKELFELRDENNEVMTSNFVFKTHQNNSYFNNRNSSDLPMEGEVDLTANNNDNNNGNLLDTSFVEDGEVLDDDKQEDNIINNNNNNNIYSVSDYIECDSNSSDVAINNNNNNNNNNNRNNNDDNDNENNREKRLLKALFDGDVISSVYDHSYVDPSSSSINYYEEKRIQKEAREVVNNSIKKIENSSVLYNNSNNSNNNDSSIGHNGSFLSSSTLLNSLRQMNRNNNANNYSEIVNNNNNNINHNNEINDTIITRPKVSIQQDVINRLNNLFNKNDSNTNTNNNRNQLNRMIFTTDFILNQFKDLGDQYAPLFRDCLRSVAYLEDGVWVKK